MTRINSSDLLAHVAYHARQKAGLKDEGDVYSTAPFPHCDPRFLHAPGECTYCDHYPHYQALRQTWGINFTGHSDEYSLEMMENITYVERGVLPPRGHWESFEKFKEYTENMKPNYRMLPCPANFNRDQRSIDHWPGNVATKIIDEGEV